MKVDALTRRAWVRPSRLYLAFKYTIYLLLLSNIVLFGIEDYTAAQETFSGQVSWRQLAEAYAATLDTAAWVVLLLLFELETAVIPDTALKGNLRWILLAVRGLSYAFILWAFTGYVSKLLLIGNLEPFVIDDVCTLIGSSHTWVELLDQYLPIDAAACAALNGQPLWQVAGTEIIGTTAALRQAWDLAMVDIINAGDWLVIVFLLELEVLLQLWNRLSTRLISLFKFVKGLLYLTLLGAAVYWWLFGDFLDFWDAFLWLVAFVFIEMNIFKWHAEVEEEKAHHGGRLPVELVAE